MPSNLQWLLIGALSVSMVTAAPLTSQEKLVDVEQAGESVDRAKRADEEIVFGNQQNKARVMAKKSDLSNVLAPLEPQGELDQGSEVIVHKEMPIPEDMAARAEASLGETDEKMAQAVESAMETVAKTEQAQTETGGQESAEENAAEKVSKEVIEEEIEDAGEQGAGEASEVMEEAQEEAAEEEDEEDEDLKNLEMIAAEESAEEGETGSSGAAISGPVHDDEVDQFLQELQQHGEDSGIDLGLQDAENDNDMKDYYRKMYQYMMLPYSSGNQMLQGLPYYYYRRRRSVQAAKNGLAAAAGSRSHRGRRIKRDLLDDGAYDPYDIYTVPYSPMEVDDALINDPDDYVPLSDEEAEYLYKRLLDYLASNYVEDRVDAFQEPESVESYLRAYEEPEEEPYVPYSIYNEDENPYEPSPYDEGYPYGPVDLDTYETYAKRGMVDYYPQEEDKRYFFPFSEEPETHWGAFVPEKRDYDEAIQRLQRLAMALSDNPGPYYREMLEEYRRK